MHAILLITRANIVLPVGYAIANSHVVVLGQIYFNMLVTCKLIPLKELFRFYSAAGERNKERDFTGPINGTFHPHCGIFLSDKKSAGFEAHFLKSARGFVLLCSLNMDVEGQLEARETTAGGDGFQAEEFRYVFLCFAVNGEGICFCFARVSKWF